MTHAVVSGGASGIGAQCALQLADEGYDVTVLDLADATAVLEQVRARGRQAWAHRVYVSDRAAVHDAVAAAVREAGGLDAVVSAAGIWGSAMSLDELDEAEVDRVLGVNLHGSIWLAQACMPHLRASRGRLVCVGSEAGRVGGRRVAVPYAASKGAIHSLVRTLARQEAPHGVLVNGVAPGLVATPMVEGRGYDPSGRLLGRAAQPEEIAAVVAFLCSPKASYVNGAVVDVNGGEYVS